MHRTNYAQSRWYMGVSPPIRSHNPSVRLLIHTALVIKSIKFKWIRPVFIPAHNEGDFSIDDFRSAHAEDIANN